MKLIIEISEKSVNEIKDNVMFADDIPNDIRWDITKAIFNGKSLPKEHERLIEQEPKTGHWITGRSIFFDVEVYCCSECKSWFAYKAEKCPNCHARMVKEKENKE